MFVSLCLQCSYWICVLVEDSFVKLWHQECSGGLLTEILLFIHMRPLSVRDIFILHIYHHLRPFSVTSVLIIIKKVTRAFYFKTSQNWLRNCSMRVLWSCRPVFAGLSKLSVGWLQLPQNAAVLICTQHFEHNTPVLKSFHWLQFNIELTLESFDWFGSLGLIIRCRSFSCSQN